MGGSSSHRRKNPHHPRSNLNPNSRSSNSVHVTSTNHPTRSSTIPVPAPPSRTLTFDNLTITQGPGFDLLCKSGWVPGQVLGSSAPSSYTSSNSIYNQTSSNSTSQDVSEQSSALYKPLPIVVRQGRLGVGAGSATTQFDTSNSTSTVDQPESFAQSAPATPKGRGRTLKSNNVSNRHNKKYHGHSHPRFSQRRNNNNNGNSTMSPSTPPTITTTKSNKNCYPISPALITQLANLDIFDPLRPRCQYDSNHIVRDLKALRKHELTCPANPSRENSASHRRLSTSPFSPPTSSLLQSGNRLSFSSSSADSLQDEADISDSLSTSSLGSDDEDEKYSMECEA